jgi:hypothetical protein
MSEKLSPSLEGKLPSSTNNAEIISKWVPKIALHVAGLLVPGAGLAGDVLDLAREVYQRKAEKLLLEELRKGNVQDLSQGQLVPLIPMAYKFFEAAKEGEYERNLRILAAFLRGELEQRSPDASNFARMVRRVEGLSLTDLKVMAMIDVSLSKTTPFLDEGTKGKRPFVSATMLSKSSQNKDGLTTIQIQEALVDLASRGFLIADGATRMSKSEEFYFVSSSFGDLMGRAREQVVSEGNGTETSG